VSGLPACARKIPLANLIFDLDQPILCSDSYYIAVELRLSGNAHATFTRTL